MTASAAVKMVTIAEDYFLGVIREKGEAKARLADLRKLDEVRQRRAAIARKRRQDSRGWSGPRCSPRTVRDVADLLDVLAEKLDGRLQADCLFAADLCRKHGDG